MFKVRVWIKCVLRKGKGGETSGLIHDSTSDFLFYVVGVTLTDDAYQYVCLDLYYYFYVSLDIVCMHDW